MKEQALALLEQVKEAHAKAVREEQELAVRKLRLEGAAEALQVVLSLEEPAAEPAAETSPEA